MLKRKHDDPSSSETPPNRTTARALRLQRLHLDALLDQSKTSLFRSLKVARGFERQKLGRRQKTAKAENNATDTARLDAEVVALKSLDLASTAEIHLYKSLLKIKSVASAPAFPHHVQATVDAARKRQEVASANVQARLFKSGPVQGAMVEALREVRAALGVGEVKASGRKRMRAKDYADGHQTNDMDGAVVLQRERSSVSHTRAQDEDGRSGGSAPESLEDHEALDVDDQDRDVDYKIYASRLALPSDESSLESDLDAQNQNHDRSNLDAMSITDDEDDPPSDPEAEAPSPEPTNAPHSKHPTANPNPKPKPPTSTTFLPSLSLAGYWSGSDSASSSDPAANSHPPVRKNRMGQQARRALWERKFGREANHVRRRAVGGDGRGGAQGWDGRKGAQEWDGRKGAQGQGRGKTGKDAGRGGRFARSTGANSDPVGARKGKGKGKEKEKGAAEGPLHPSWEAARKKKERKVAVPFLGKKVVFD